MIFFFLFTSKNECLRVCCNRWFFTLYVFTLDNFLIDGFHEMCEFSEFLY